MPEQNMQIGKARSSVLFLDLERQETERILSFAGRCKVEQGQYVYRQGENNRCFYIISDGEVELILHAGSDSQLSVGHIGPGGHFGETSLLTESGNSLSVLALTDLDLLTFDAAAFTDVLLVNPTIQRRLSVSLAQRLRVSFQDHANSLTRMKTLGKSAEHTLDQSFFRTTLTPSALTGARLARETRLTESTIYRQITKAVKRFSNSHEPVLITGETGTGRRMVAYEIHNAGSASRGPYTELDIRHIDPAQLETELFGYGHDSPAFSQVDQLGIFERIQSGTLVLYNAEYLEPDMQRQLAAVMKKGCFTRVGGEARIPLRARIILICKDNPQQQDGYARLLPALYGLVAGNHFQVAPLREHRRDIPRLVQYYLKRFSLQYGKSINTVDDRTLGRFMNYHWPGNLSEMASVLQRAVILGKNNEPLSDELLLGVPRSEGKLEFNLLRLAPIRAFLSSRLFPVLPRALVGIAFAFVLAVLFFGPTTAENNIGLTLSWVVGWPLMIFAFFFLARTWCSVCGLSVPGWLAQIVLKPERATPKVIRNSAGWIMTGLCILLFWIETTWNAYQSPRLTAWIILSVTMGSFLFSIFFKRRVWCRYLCPLGAVNALFSMPSILELRANTHMCMNRCEGHACYTGDDQAAGCPMFRHPFLVDNNRDCILCGQCIKNCRLNSIHLNLRLAPQELWNQQSPRLADSVLVISLAAIFYPFIVSQNFPEFLPAVARSLASLGLNGSIPFTASIFFIACIVFYLSGYGAMSGITAKMTGNNWKTTAAIFGYGMIPLVVGAYMAAHLEILVRGIWLLPANLLELVGIGQMHSPARPISPDATAVLQIITVLGGLIASLYATRRIIRRLAVSRPYGGKMFALPAFLLCLSALAYIRLV